MAELLAIGEVSRRSGVAASALRFYEERGLISSERVGSGHRRYPRPVLRRVAFIVFAQRVGLTLGEIAAELAQLPGSCADAPRLVATLSNLGLANRPPDGRAGATQSGAHRVHRLWLPFAGPLQTRQPG